MPPPTTIHYYPPPPTAIHNDPPPTTTIHHHSPPPTIIHNHSPPSTTIHHQMFLKTSQNSQENTWQVNWTEQVELNRIISTNVVIFIEAVANTCSIKKIFLEIWQNSQQNTCDRVSCLIKLQASGFSYRTLNIQFWLLQLFLYNTSFSITNWKKCMNDLKTLN